MCNYEECCSQGSESHSHELNERISVFIHGVSRDIQAHIQNPFFPFELGVRQLSINSGN